jgi:V8-like Glu-specific endopeptidase
MNRVDWELVKLDRKVKGQMIATLSKKDIFFDQSIYVIGHPVGLPLKYAPGARVGDIRGSYFTADLDVYSDNAGSPVFCSETHDVIGMVVRGDSRDFRWTGKGFMSVIYPNPVITSKGAQCTRVSEFINIVDRL